MKLKQMSKQELDALSYADIADMILKEEKKVFNTPKLFHKICELLDYSEDDYESKIGDFYTSLTTDKRFILLDDGKWDLRDHHAVKIVLDDDDDEELEEEEEEIEEPEEEIMDDDSDDLDDDDDDLEDLAIIDDSEIEE